MPTIGLSMIVKDEAHVIARCLDSLRPLLDAAVIVDTGSTDGTQAVVRDYLARAGIPGEVVEEPWRDFASNRTSALAALRRRAEVDYALVMDADDKLAFAPGFDAKAFKAGLSADVYDVDIRHGGVDYVRPQIFSNRLPFAYRSVLHEYLDVPPAAKGRARAEGLHIVYGGDGGRSRDPGKYRKDAAVLERALETETDPFLRARYTFYLAQSWRDCGERERAAETYLARAEMGFWDQEVYVALLNAGRLWEALGRDADAVLSLYARAGAACPQRAEAAHAASRLCRVLGRNRQGRDAAAPFAGLAPPADGLFIEGWIYRHGLRDELAVNSFWSGLYAESRDACLAALESEDLPAGERKRVIANLRAALDKLGTRPALATPDPAASHALAPPRTLDARLPSPAPRVLLAILAKQKASVLPLYLECIEKLDYPKASIALYIRTNNNTDDTKAILEAWVERVGPLYAAVEFDGRDVDIDVQRFAIHEWNATRFRVLGHIRDVSLGKTAAHGCDFYFTADCDNFLKPSTLRSLISLDLPIVAPLLRHIDVRSTYSNYHAAVDDAGYFRDSEIYHPVLYRAVRGVIEMPVVHCTYAVRADVIARVGYSDGTDRHEYVVFSDRARKNDVAQYFDNRELYGYLTLDDGDPTLIGAQLETIRTSLARVAVEPAPSPSGSRVLLFCTAYASDEETWNTRYRRWIDHVRASKLTFDRLVIFDDGSPVLPDWPDAAVIAPEADDDGTKPVLIVHFPDRLGRNSVFDFPGWYRSFTEAGKFAKRGGYTKAIHVESDSFLISDDIQSYVDGLSAGWTAFWVNRFGYAESALQVIGQDQMAAFAGLREALPHARIIGREYEKQLPFTKVERRFLGDRYGEYLPTVPLGADYVVSAKMREGESYYWWLDPSHGGAADPHADAERWHALADVHFGEDHAAALDAYLCRAERSRCEEDRFLALLKAGSALERRDGAPLDDILDLYARATLTAPHRAEALHHASRLCFARGAHRRGYEIAKGGLHLAAPVGGVGVEGWIYEYGLRDEYATNAYWSGHFRDCALTCIDLLTQRNVPQAQKGRIHESARLSLEKMLG